MFELMDVDSQNAVIKVLGVGGGGGNAVAHMLASGIEGVDFIHTDVWVSMGEAESAWEKRIELLKPYQVNRAIMAASGNPRVKFMHCLPAFHDLETEVGSEIHERFGLDAMEVTEEVFESPAGIQFEQAENRVHSIKALLVATLGS